MGNTKMGALEGRFADIIWENEPIASGQLVKLAQLELSWKPTTSYTVLKRLCERGIFQNSGGTVTSLLSREAFYAMQSEQFVEETFDGSLPAFLAAFTSRKALSDKEVEELKEIIDGLRR
ncbi:MAG: BlaI/MecI/CopY family transcriptional regulator [Oscillospiraceae bacterium]|nr:BlaI/MecI/CopY family transcriptional regulator [Oscillospiraceae bacterium]